MSYPSARWWLPSVMLGALVTGGCDRYVDVRHHEAISDLAETRGAVFGGLAETDGTLRPVGEVGEGELTTGKEVVIPLAITGVNLAVVIAACDGNCADLDIKVVDSSGRMVGIDEDEDAYPRVVIEAGESRKLALHVKMISCAASPCAFAYQQLEFESPEAGTSSGTCFAVAPDGYVMTALHVVENAGDISVSFPDGRTATGMILRRSADNDLALLRVGLSTPDWLPFAATGDITVGMPAFAVGFPAPDTLGSEVKYTEGTVSALSGMDNEATLLQVAIPIQPGNSGGPVVSSSGSLIGVVVAYASPEAVGAEPQMVNYARNARVAALLMPPQLKIPALAPTRSREAAVKRAMQAVCRIDAS